MEMYSKHKSGHSLLHREGAWRVSFLAPVLLFFASWSITGCQTETTIDPEEQARRDSAALHVALMPVHECIPFYYAQRMGFYDSLGLDLRIQTLQAQLDTDTALMRHRAEVVYSDLARAIMMQQDTTPLRAIAALDIDLRLITARRGRVRQLPQLRERMVAVARHSITDYWSDRLTDTAQLARSDIFRPQINDLRVRIDMLCNGTMDAAFLPEPYANEAVVRGNRANFSTRGLEPQLVALVASEQALADTTRHHQMELLMQGYAQAVEALNKRPQADTLVVLYRQLFQVSDTLIDTLISLQPRFLPLRTPRAADANAALQWLKGRKQVRNGYTADSLILDFPL